MRCDNYEERATFVEGVLKNHFAKSRILKERVIIVMMVFIQVISLIIDPGMKKYNKKTLVKIVV